MCVSCIHNKHCIAGSCELDNQKYDLKGSNLCQSGRNLSSNFLLYFIERLLVGVFLSDCKKPCLTTTVSISERAVSTHLVDYHSIYFTIPKKILTTIIKEDSFELMESLNFLGSNLGLWPGLGLFQLFEGSIALILALKLMAKLNWLLAPSK